MSPRRKSLVVPREHGAWGILLVPLFSGAATGLLAGGRPLPLIPFTIAALALFWMRTPLESWLGTTPLRAHSAEELSAVRRAVVVLAAVSLAGLVTICWGGRNAGLAPIGGIAALAFAAQALLKKRSRIAAQIIGAAGLTATAPAAYYLATGQFTLALWVANLLFAANQIHFGQLRIHSARITDSREKFLQGRGFVAGQMALIAILAAACAAGFFSWLAALAFVPLLIRGFAWFIGKPQPLAVRRLGWSELVLATAFGVLLVSATYLS